jgi:hypothetical protein
MQFLDLSKPRARLFASFPVARKMLSPLPDSEYQMLEVLNDPNPTGQPQVPLRTYDVTDQQAADLANRFTYHSPKPDQQPRYVAMREKFRQLAEFILAHTPPSREQSHALTLLDDASFNANAAIARHE